jgi:hypothetical protein
MIYKFPLEITRYQELTVPEMGRKVLTLQVQDFVPTLWIEFNVKAAALFEIPKNNFRVEMFGTGWKIPAGVREYLGTALVDGHVWHYYQVP